MPSSLTRFKQERVGEDQDVHWGRLEADGLPIRGDMPKFLKEEEIQAGLYTAPYFKNRTFNTGDPKENRLYQKVMDGWAAGWFTILRKIEFREPPSIHHYVYIEWVETYKQHVAASENKNGRRNGPDHPAAGA